VLDESGARAQYFTQHNRTVPDPRYPHSASPWTFWNLLNSLFISLPSPPVVASRSFFKLFLHSPTAPSSFAVQHIKRSQHQPVRLTLRRNPLFLEPTVGSQRPQFFKPALRYYTAKSRLSQPAPATPRKVRYGTYLVL
jgi:hypothetical protein